MHPNNIFTRKRMGLDNNVWVVMSIFIILSAGLFGYNRINKEEKKTCETIDIIVNGRKNIKDISFNPGEQITFRLSPISMDDKVIWDFGDDTNDDKRVSPVHAFNQETTFTVWVTVNGNCPYQKKIKIERISPTNRDSIGNPQEDIIGEGQATVGQKMTFLTPLQAQTYEWQIENNRFYSKQTGKEVSFTFRGQGKYMVVLVLDNDPKKKYTKSVIISKPLDADAPEKLIQPDNSKEIQRQIEQNKQDAKDQQQANPVITPKNDSQKKPRKKFISEPVFKEKLQLLVCGEMGVKDFDAFLCLGGSTPASINNKRKTFEAVCAEIQGKKKIKIEDVKLGRDSENEDCVINIIIKSDKKWGLGKNPCKN